MTEEEVTAELKSVYEALDILDKDTALSNKEWIGYATHYTARKRELEQQLAEVREKATDE